MTTGIRADSLGTYGALQVGGADVMRYGQDNSGQLAPFRNKIINGGCQVAQRGATSFSAGILTYGGADRIYTYVQNGSGTLQQLAAPVANLSGSGFYQACGAFTTTAPGVVILGTRIESKDATRLNGKKITVSVNVYQDSGSSRNFFVQLKKAGAVDNFTSTTLIAESTPMPCGHTVATRLTFTQQLSATGGADGIEVNVVCSDWPTLSGKFFGIGDFQLEEGSIATPFEHRPIGLELSLCQRYFQTIPGFYGTGSAAYACQIKGTYSVPMRATPTVALNTALQIDDTQTAFTQSSANIGTISGHNNLSYKLTAGNFTGLTIRQVYFENAGSLLFSAEL